MLALVVLIILLLSSDMIIIPQVTSKHMAVSVIQYLNPMKYSVWVFFMITSYQYIDYQGITQIIGTNNLLGADVFISFKNIWIPLSITTLILGGYFIHNYFYFKWGVK
ncbi:hypothetical protein [Spiroplasma clarkii]|uniref:hypothetical protein n=1 Tax=Spiroplasma clarkii TaxID=2139 RepID=UPI0011BA505C|nr:hypothetical protein [Spiroplasma clarkii]